MVLIHVSANAGQRVIGLDVGRNPNARPDDEGLLEEIPM